MPFNLDRESIMLFSHNIHLALIISPYIVSCGILGRTVNAHDNQQNSDYYDFGNSGIDGYNYYDVEDKIYGKSNLIAKEEAAKVKDTVVNLLILLFPFNSN